MNHRFNAMEKKGFFVILALLVALLAACGGGGGGGSASSPVTIPAAPTNLQATAASSTNINLTWLDASNNEEGFKIYRGTTSTTVTTLVATVSAGITSYPDTGLTASTTYYYKVTAYNSAGESAASDANATTNPPAVTIPAAPTGLQAIAVSGTAINLAWIDASNNEDGFRVYRAYGANPASYTKIGADLGANVEAFTDTTASGGTQYLYRVTAFNSAGESSPAQSAAVTTPLGPASVAAGNRHSLALMSDGTVRAWGSNDDGQLGVGASPANSLTPIPITGLTGVSAISASDTQSLALMNNGTIMGWGLNYFGEVGNGDNVIQYTPVQVLQSLGGPNFTNVSSISAGGYYSVALKTDGTVWAWGSGQYGQIGNNSYNDHFSPVQVNVLTSVQAISASQNHTLALKSDGTVWAWGSNDVGEIGNGTTNDNALVPVQVLNLAGVVAVSAGANHSLALLNDNTVRAWGGNSFGQLGDGTTTDKSTPVPVSGLTNVKAISAGGNFSVALKNDGTVWAWGANEVGEVGNNSLTDQHTPVQVLTNVQAISASQLTDLFSLYCHTLALRGDIKTIWAWGNNTYGQIGDGTITDRQTPVSVSGL